VKLTFLGTRGEIELRTKLHRMHTSLAVSYRGRRVMIDCGLDWLRRISKMRFDAIVLTHAHPDHSWGLKNGAPCKVHATNDTWSRLEGLPITNRATVEPRTPFHIGGITFEAFPVQHSTRAPAVGYRVTAGPSSVFYVPDLIYIFERHEALSGVRIYIGDGASLRRPLVRNRGGVLVGHTSVSTQLGWCEREGVRRVIITHCGTEIVSGKRRVTETILREMGQQHGLDVQMAFDGLDVRLP
jgi:phosphoribosyl 1,2-cyclic phosphodiesterase